MRKKWLGLAFILVLCATGSWWYVQGLQNKSDSLRATGTIEATTVNLTSKLSGTIKSLPYREGDSVAAGELVAELTRSDLVAQKERDALGVVSAEARLADLVNGPRPQEIEEASAQTELAHSSHAQAESDLARVEALFRAGAVSREQLEQARLNLSQKAAQLKAAQARLSLLESGSRPAAIEAARAEAERSRAVLQASQAMLDDLKITSPIQGIITTCNYEPGEFVSAGSTLATVVDLQRLWIRVYIPTDDLPNLRLGQPVRCTVSGYSQSFAGTVKQIASRGEFTPKTIQTEKERANVVFAVKIALDTTQGVLKPGMPADVVFVKE